MVDKIIVVGNKDNKTVDHIRTILGKTMGPIHVFYAIECIRERICHTLTLYYNNKPAGIGVYYRIPLQNKQYITIIYYIAIAQEYQGRSLGKIIVSSIEELNNNTQVFIATTTIDNTISIKMFTSLGYTPIHIDELYKIMKPRLVDRLIMMTCSHEDDVFLIKILGNNNLDNLDKLVQLTDKRIVKSIWRKICYNPWLKLLRTKQYIHY